MGSGRISQFHYFKSASFHSDGWPHFLGHSGSGQVWGTTYSWFQGHHFLFHFTEYIFRGCPRSIDRRRHGAPKWKCSKSLGFSWLSCVLVPYYYYRWRRTQYWFCKRVKMASQPFTFSPASSLRVGLAWSLIQHWRGILFSRIAWSAAWRKKASFIKSIRLLSSWSPTANKTPINTTRFEVKTVSGFFITFYKMKLRTMQSGQLHSLNGLYVMTNITLML